MASVAAARSAERSRPRPRSTCCAGIVAIAASSRRRGRAPTGDPGCRTSWLAEGEHVGAGPGVEEGDADRALADRAVLPDQLVEPFLREDPVAVLVDVEPVGATWWLPVERHPVAHGRAARRGTHHEVDVPPAEAV